MILVRTTGVVLVLYIAISLLFYAFQEKFVFQGNALRSEHTFQFNQPFREFTIPTHDDQQLSALYFPAQDSSRGLILYFHGNADHLQRWGNYAGDFTQLGYDVLMMDYRGYGKSTGSPSEELLYRDALTVWNWASVKWPSPNIIIYGRSLGSAVASHLAIEKTPSLLALETPFDEMRSVIYPAVFSPLRWLPAKHFFSNKEHLPKVTCRKLVVAGEDDWIVPLSSTLRLKPLLREEDAFIVIPEGGHHNLSEFPAFHDTLKKYLP